MKNWIVKFVSLSVVNVVLLALIIVLFPYVHSGRGFVSSLLGLAWAGIILALASTLLKPILSKVVAGTAKEWSSRPAWLKGKVLNFAVVYVVSLLLWWFTVVFSNIRVQGGLIGWLLGFILPPLVLMVGWVIYDVIDDKIESKTAQLYDKAGAALGKKKR